MTLNKNILIGAGAIVAGLYLAKRAKDNGKIVPLIGRFIPSKPAPKPVTESNFSNANYRQSISDTWEY